MAKNFKKLLGGIQKAKILHYTVINTLFQKINREINGYNRKGDEMKACPEGMKNIIEKSKPNLGQPESYEEEEEEEKESTTNMLSDIDSPTPILVQ